MKCIAARIVFFACLFFACNAPTNDKPAFINTDELRTPEEELSGFVLADGFEIELVASERDGIINPIDLTFDDAGRLWTQTAAMYPLDPIADAEWNDLLRLMDDVEEQKKHPSFKRILDLYKGVVKGTDKILVLSDLYNDNKPKVEVWADSLAIPMSILPYKNGAYVAQGSELFFLDDTNGDGKADKRIPLLTGFGYVDTHTMTHALVRAPGDWIHFSHGALNKGEITSLTSNQKIRINYSKIGRFSLDAKKVELVNAGLNNIWGFQLRSTGQWFATEANDLGYSVVPMEPGTGFPGIGSDRLHTFQPWMPVLHQFRVGGTGISGLAFADDISGSFPEQWRDVAILANPITSSINAVRIKRNNDGTVQAEHLSDLLTSKDKFFRPVNIEFGPDGCLYIADWYDKIISHNEVPRNDPNRDKSFGRIWRIKHKDQKTHPVVNLSKMETAKLVSYLQSPSLWNKRAAWHQISDRDIAETKVLAPALVKIASDESEDEITRIHALWSLEGIKHYDAGLINKLLTSGGDDLRRESIRALASFPIEIDELVLLLEKLIEDKNPMVRSQVLRTIYDVNNANVRLVELLVKACKPDLSGNEMGGSYERKFERFLALRALEKYAGHLQQYLASVDTSKMPVLHLIWAAQALPEIKRESTMVQLLQVAKLEKLDEPTFVMLSDMLHDQKIYKILEPTFRDPSNATEYVRFVANNRQQIKTKHLSSLMENPVKQVLKKGTDQEKLQAVDIIGNLEITSAENELVVLLDPKSPAELTKKILNALQNQSKKNGHHFLKVMHDQHYPIDVRLAALSSLAMADVDKARSAFMQWRPELKDDDIKQFADYLAASKEGSQILLYAVEKEAITPEHFGLSAAEKLYSNHLKNSTAKSIVEQARKKAAEERKMRIANHQRFLAIVEKKDGDPSKGKKIFESTCLLCHKVGDKGQDIAPALDGSAARSNDALLTAILNPDAAMETGYALYRVTKSDNSIIEGYLYKKDDKGSTLAMIGGAKTFVDKESVKSEGFVGGRSFMPKGLIDGYSEDQVADLFAYIRTLD